MKILPVLTSVLMISVAATSDSFVIGLGFGLKGVRIGFFSNLYISLVCFLGTAAAVLSGSLAGRVFPSAFAEALGGAVLLGLGTWMLAGNLKGKGESLHGVCTAAECVDKDNSKKVELRESVSIGLVLCVNNMGLGIGAGISGLPVLPTSSICAAASFAFLGLGCRLGRFLGAGRLSGALEALSALMVIALGLGSFF